MSSSNPRDDRPAAPPQKPFLPSPAVEFEVEGARVLLHERRDLPLARMQFVFAGGSVSDPLEKAGLADLTASLLREGAGDRDAVAFAAETDRLGASFGVAAGPDTTVVYVGSLKRRVHEAVGLLHDAVVRPRFDAAAFARVKTQTIGALRQRDEQPAAAAAIAAARALFGAEHPLGRPSDGRPDTVERIGLADVRGRWAVAAQEPVVVIAAGDFGRDELADLVAPVLKARRARAAGLAVKLPHPPCPAPVRAEKLRVVVVDRPGAPQSVVQFAWPGPAYADPLRLPYAVAMTVFGGSFTSRLNDNLRERHGYTYGARARGDYFRGRPGAPEGFGLAVASAAVQAEVTGAATSEFLVEFERMRAGDVTAAEVAKAKATIRNGRVTACETLEGLLGDLAVIANYVLPPDRNARDLARLATVDAAEANAAARRHLVPDGGVLAIAGDRRVVLPELAKRGLPEPEVREKP